MTVPRQKIAGQPMSGAELHGILDKIFGPRPSYLPERSLEYAEAAVRAERSSPATELPTPGPDIIEGSYRKMPDIKGFMCGSYEWKTGGFGAHIDGASCSWSFVTREDAEADVRAEVLNWF